MEAEPAIPIKRATRGFLRRLSPPAPGLKADLFPSAIAWERGVRAPDRLAHKG